MVPNFIIEGMAIVFTLLVIGCGVLFLPQRWKRYGLILLGLVAIGCSSFWYIRPTLVNQQIAEDEKLLKIELARRFPDEVYTTKTQKFLYESSANPASIEVEFANEPDVTYFLDMDGNRIRLSSFIFKNGGFPQDLQHEFK